MSQIKLTTLHLHTTQNNINIFKYKKKSITMSRSATHELAHYES